MSPIFVNWFHKFIHYRKKKKLRQNSAEILFEEKAPFILCKFDIKDNSGAVNGKFIGAEAQKFHLTTLFVLPYHSEMAKF